MSDQKCFKHCNTICQVWICVFVLVLVPLCKLFFLLTQKSIRQVLDSLCSVVTGLLYVEQVSGGGVQENPLFPVAR